MATSLEIHPGDCWERCRCPYCPKVFPAGNRVGTGKKSEGGFCSLDCCTRFAALDIQERLNRSGAPGQGNE